MHSSNRLTLFFISAALVLAVLFSSAFSAQSPAAAQSETAVPFVSLKTADKSAIFPTETVNYTIHLENNSDEAATANVVDILPSEMTFVACAAISFQPCIYHANNNTVEWTPFLVPAHTVADLVFTAKPAVVVTQETLTVNAATVSIVGVETGGGLFNYPVAVVNLLPTPQPLNAYKSASQRFLAPGETLTYTIQVINSDVTSKVVEVVDAIPAQLEFQVGSQSHAGVWDPALKTLTWNLTVNPQEEVDLTFNVKIAQGVDLSTRVAVTNQALVTFSDPRDPTAEPGIFTVKDTIYLVQTPVGDDHVRPVVDSVKIGDADVLTNPNVTLHIQASDNSGAVAWMWVREWSVKRVSGQDVYSQGRSTGWVPFQAEYPWTLASADGVHFVAVVVADAEYNRSMLSANAIDFASLTKDQASTSGVALVPYLVNYQAGQAVNATLTITSGDADLYVWYPNNFDEPDQQSVNPGTATEAIGFTAPETGAYIILVHAKAATTYHLSLTPAGGPAAAGIVKSEGLSAFTSEPVFSAIGMNPIGVISSITAQPYKVQLPMIRFK